jgi:hypothetical protein
MYLVLSLRHRSLSERWQMRCSHENCGIGRQEVAIGRRRRSIDFTRPGRTHSIEGRCIRDDLLSPARETGSEDSSFSNIDVGLFWALLPAIIRSIPHSAAWSNGCLFPSQLHIMFGNESSRKMHPTSNYYPPNSLSSGSLNLPQFLLKTWANIFHQGNLKREKFILGHRFRLVT